MSKRITGYMLVDVLELLGIENQSVFSRSGLAELLCQPARGMYDAEQVEAWAERLARRRAWIALGVLSSKSALLDAPDDDSYDFACPRCGALACHKPPADAAEMEAWVGGVEWPAACSKCGKL